MIGDALEAVIQALIQLIWRVGFMIFLPVLGLYYTRWHKPLIVVLLLIPVLMVSIEVHRQWLTDKHRFVTAYVIAKTEHLPFIYHNERSFPDIVLGLNFPDEWKTYGDARVALLQSRGGRDYWTVRYFIDWQWGKAIQLNLCFIALGYVYGAFYAMLAARAALREH
ncbi:hypothetical protein [Candidatus Puniceispirillum marinum]|uniref:hypothetical protein n=1 Tax=Candidatus Puniceispirillum marinum TaxID=767892 RepID=UPI0005A43CFC|nr:hypothetical protein [Candidatus Puniceispirillum marinum]